MDLGLQTAVKQNRVELREIKNQTHVHLVTKSA